MLLVRLLGIKLADATQAIERNNVVLGFIVVVRCVEGFWLCNVDTILWWCIVFVLRLSNCQQKIFVVPLSLGGAKVSLL